MGPSLAAVNVACVSLVTLSRSAMLLTMLAVAPLSRTSLSAKCVFNGVAVANAVWMLALLVVACVSGCVHLESIEPEEGDAGLK
jgi:hypothetical protein